MPLRSAFALVLALTAGSALAADYRVEDLYIDSPHARPTIANQPTSAAYLTIENRGTGADKLIAASSPIAKSVEIHTMSMEGNVMKMREVPNIALPPAAKITMQPGNGYHLMLFGLRQPLKAGETFPMTLTFEKAGKTDVTVTVGNMGMAKEGGMPHMR